MSRMAGLGVVIVGGTGGLGRAMASRMLQEGAAVVVSGVEEEWGVPETAALGARVWDFTADVTDEAQVERLFEFAKEALGGRIDVLIHVAGISGRRFGDGALHDCTAEGWDRVMEVNARGAFLTNREAVRVMMKQERDGWGRRGAVVNVGSVLAGSPSAQRFGTVAYAASKGALRALTTACAARYAGDGIRFNLIEPALVDTPMAARAVGDPSMAAYLGSKMPLSGGALQAGSVAEAAVFLSCPESRDMTGAVLTIDGGWCVSEGGDGGIDGE